MDKLILMAGLIGPLLIALIMARGQKPRRGLRRTIILFCVFTVLYVAALLFLYRGEL
jgi:formate hydrogenlyase subunit 3/multisubunit Na+/H+ antiporter MnhD subunit